MPITTSTSNSNDGPRQRNLPNGVAKPDRHTNGTAATYMNGSTTAGPSNIKTREAANSNGQPVTAAAPVVDWEIPRKTLHSSIGFLVLWLWKDGSAERVVVALSGALAIIAPTDVVRLRVPRFARIYESVLGFLMRESEKTHSNGVIWYLVGTIAVLHFLPLDIATVSILILSWADTAASTFGRLWGRYTPPLPRRVPLLGLPLAPRKSLAGFLAASITGAATAMLFWRYAPPFRLGGASSDISWSFDQGFQLPTDDAVGRAILDAGYTGFKANGWLGFGIIGLVAGAVTGIAEALDVGTWDDNLTLPVLTGACLWAFFKAMSYVS